MQAHINAIMRSDEFIMESLVTFDKIKVLIYDLLATEVWKQKVLPLIKHRLLECSSFRAYVTVKPRFRFSTRPASATSCRSCSTTGPPSSPPTPPCWNSPTTPTEKFLNYLKTAEKNKMNFHIKTSST